MLGPKCQIEGCRPYPATKKVRVRLNSGLVGIVRVCEMHYELHKADTRKKDT